MQTFKQFGPIAMYTHIALSVLFYGASYAVVKRGVDISKLLKMFRLNRFKQSENIGTAGIAYGLYKVLMPVRLAVTAAVVPLVCITHAHESSKDPVNTAPASETTS